MQKDIEKCFRAQKELLDNIPQFYPQDNPKHAPLSEFEQERILQALQNSGVEHAGTRYKAEGAHWLYQTLNMLAYSHAYPDGDEPQDLRYTPGDQGKHVEYGDYGPDSILQRRERDGWRDYYIDGKPATPPIDFGALPPGSYRLV